MTIDVKQGARAGWVVKVFTMLQGEIKKTSEILAFDENDALSTAQQCQDIGNMVFWDGVVLVQGGGEVLAMRVIGTPPPWFVPTVLENEKAKGKPA